MKRFTRPGKLLHNYGKSPFLMAKSTISTGPFSIAPPSQFGRSLVTFSRLQLAEISRRSNEMGAWKLRSSLVTWLVVTGTMEFYDFPY